MTDRELDLNVSVQTGTPGKPVKKTVSVWWGWGGGGCRRRLRSMLSLDLCFVRSVGWFLESSFLAFRILFMHFAKYAVFLNRDKATLHFCSCNFNSNFICSFE